MAENAALNSVRKTSMGATFPYWAEVDTDVTEQMPTYKDGTEFSEFIKVTENLQKAESQFYSNDALSESADEFKYCELTFDNKGVPNTLKARLYGATLEGNKITYGAGDNPPMGGFAFYRVLQDNGTKYYEGVFYPRVKASLTGMTYDTKGENVTFNGEQTKLIAYACKNVKQTWKQEEIFETAEEALAWVKERLGIAAGA